MPKPKSFTAWLKTSTTPSGISLGTSPLIQTGPDARDGRAKLDYLDRCGAIDRVIETLERAWTQYEAYRAAQSDA
ncbi:hypothetical protein ACWCQ1_50525 [Streptomyces sp. NPDC002144]